MIPRTFPSILGALGETKMVVYVLPSVSGLQAWKDYIPVKGITTENTAVQNTYANDGYQVMSPLEDISTKQAWKDYIPVFEDASYTKAWSTDAGGYIPASGLFSVYSLFANNEQGVWHDPSDLTTLFQDAVGTTPVTAVEQPVGLMLDKSKGLALGPELVTNGDFSNGTTGWTAASGAIANVSGTLQVSNTGTFARAVATITTTANKWYKLTAVARYVSGAGASIRITTSSDGSNTGQLSQTATTTSSTFVALECYFLATGTTTYIAPIAGSSGAGSECYFDNISVRELTGNHAYQTTSANRPTLSARVNLLTKTEDFGDAAWTKTNTSITANAITAPDGTTTADLLTAQANANGAVVRQQQTMTSGIPYVLSCYMKAYGVNFGILQIREGANGIKYWFDLANGVIGSKTAGAIGTHTITSVGNGWYRCSVAVTYNGSSTALQDISCDSTDGAFVNGGTIYIWGADLCVANDGVGIPAYQRVNTATDYDTVGFPKYLRFNGSSSAMMTNTITPGTDKAQVFAGVRKLSDAATGILVELSSDATTVARNPGTFAIIAPSATGANSYRFSSAGAGTSVASAGTGVFAPAPDTSVLTGIGDIAADISQLRRNGILVQTSVEEQSTGNFLAYPLYIGARGGSSIWFNGRIYSMIVRFGSNLTTAQITNTEKYVNSKTKAY